jgi:hypothetical protein
VNAENPDHVADCFDGRQLFSHDALRAQPAVLPTVGAIIQHHFKATTRGRRNKREWSKHAALASASRVGAADWDAKKGNLRAHDAAFLVRCDLAGPSQYDLEIEAAVQERALAQ